MSEAAKRWISPYWQGDDTALAQAHIYVLNTTGNEATVEVTWFDAYHNVLGTDESAVLANSKMKFSIYQKDPGDRGGWLVLTSTEPVLPWGVAPALFELGERHWGTMSFFRAELPQIPIHPIP